MRIAGLDLRLFDFDHDLNFFVFLLDADQRVLARYGGRDGKSAEGKLSLVGLRHVLQGALEVHHLDRKPPAPKYEGKPLLVEELPAAKRLKRGECIHCHQVNEFRREELVKEGKWNKDLVWRYPLPENVGLTLAIDEGNLVKEVARGSPAERAGLRAGDRLRRVHGSRVLSFADVQFALDRAPAAGEVRIAWQREQKEQEASLQLRAGWKWTNITWRPSLLDILISPLLIGEDLTVKEKEALGLGAKRLAFRQSKPVPAELKRIGLRDEDVIVGIDGLVMEMEVNGFLAHLRRNFLVGETVVLNVLREGKKVDLTLKLE